jgi:cystathionine beta-lyase/cystathionine gamma-synthase
LAGLCRQYQSNGNNKSTNMNKQSKQTICVHEGQKPDEFRGINTAIYTSTSYGYLDSEERIYPRYFNIPNQKVLIDKLSKLENAESGLIFSSGMAAISTTLLSLLNKGDHIIFQKGLYGGTILIGLELLIQCWKAMKLIQLIILFRKIQKFYMLKAHQILC